MRPGFGDGMHKEMLTIAVALLAGSTALIIKTGPDGSLNGITIGMIFVGLICLAIGIRLYRFHVHTVSRDAEAERTLARERENLREIPRIDGDWEYEVKNSSVQNQAWRHSGRCQIKNDFASGPRSFRLYGTRLKNWDNGQDAVDCSIDWESNWCEFTDRGDIRLSYQIELDDEVLEGYATMAVLASGPDVTELRGKYSLYAPNGNRRTRGTIAFRRGA